VTPGLLPSGAAGLAGGAGQRIALGLVVQFGEPGLPQSLRSSGVHHRGLLGCELTLVPRMPPGPGGADRVIAQDRGPQVFRFPWLGA
jgi:hypothetical protein